jgi:quercetin dioxygenase-like cupin family protein
MSDTTATEFAAIGWGSGQPLPGTPFREVVPTAATGGAVVVLAVDMPVGKHVGEHIHQGEDQITVVLRGSIGATVDDDEVRLEDGAVFLMPRGRRHSLWNAGDQPARLLELYTPGGFEQVFAEAGRRRLAGEDTFFS